MCKAAPANAHCGAEVEDTMKKLSIVCLLSIAACGGSGMVQSGNLVGADETAGQDSVESWISRSLPVGSHLKSTANVNLRTGPSTGYHIILVVPNGATVTTVSRTSPVNGFYEVSYQGHTGYSYGYYYTLVSSGGGGGGGGGTAGLNTDSRDGAVVRGKSVAGFSYHWGGGAWDPTSSAHGACYGSCPNCTHSGSWGADCSGFVAKAWIVPSTNTPVSKQWHPYSTANFVNDTSAWHTVSRGSVAKSDAFVYNSNGAGHVFLYESGDPWGNVWAYECAGCVKGCVHDLRSVSSSYHAIRKTGW